MSPIFCKRKSFAENFPLISENMFVVAVRQEEAELWKQMFSVAVRSTSLMNDSSINISCKCVSPCCLTNPVLIGHTLHVMCFLLSQWDSGLLSFNICLLTSGSQSSTVFFPFRIETVSSFFVFTQFHLSDWGIEPVTSLLQIHFNSVCRGQRESCNNWMKVNIWQANWRRL